MIHRFSTMLVWLAISASLSHSAFSATAVFPDRDTLISAVTQSQPDYLKTLTHLVAIDSDTGHLAGSQKIAIFLREQLEPLGAQIETHHSVQPEGEHVVARFVGTGSAKILMYFHTDTVLNQQNSVPFRFDEKTQRAYGAGVADSKGSVAMGVEMMKVMHRLKLTPYKELIVYFDATEEVGSELGDSLVQDLAKTVDYALIVDSGRPDFGIVTKRKATGNFMFSIEGISGHAGNAPHATANALTEAGLIISQLAQLASPLPDDPLAYSAATLAEKGIVDRGQFIPENAISVVKVATNNSKMNVIPNQAEVHLNMRTYTQAEFDRLAGEFKKIADHPHRQGIKVTLTGGQSMPPMELNAASQKLVDLYRQVAKNYLDRDITEWVAGGVTPANFTAQYVPTIDALGVDADPMLEHSPEEVLEVDQYLPRAVALMALLHELN